MFKPVFLCDSKYTEEVKAGKLGINLEKSQKSLKSPWTRKQDM
jgi:hypothetical protein